MLVSKFPNVTTIKPISNELNTILDEIKNGKFKEQILALRKLTDEKQIKNAKLNLPNFTASGTFTECKDDSLIKHSGFIQIDIDLKDILKAGITKNELRKNLIADNYIYSLFDSPTNTGIKALVKIPTIEHLGSFLALEKYFLEKYKVQIDRSCKNISRRFFVSYDKDLFLNKDSEIFSEIALEEKEYKEFPKEIDKDLFREAIKHIPSKSKDDGKRSSYLNIIWACKTVLGESEAFSIGEKLLSSSDMIKGLPSIIRTGKTIDHPQLVFKEAISAGWTYPKKTKSKVVNINSKRNSTEGNLAVNNEVRQDTNFVEGNSNYSRIRQWLASRHSFRYNVLTDVVYFKEAEKWNPVNDRIVNNFIQDMDIEGITASDNRVNTILNSRFSKEYDAIKDYFDALDISTIKANNTHYLEDFFHVVTGKTKLEKPNEFETMKTWFCSHAGISLGEIEKVDQLYCICFQGKQGTGKTSLFRYLTPNVLKDYTKENLTDYENKDTKISLGENFLILLDELGESSKHDLIKLKSLITQKSIKERRPHAKRDTVLLRRAGFIGTFDKEQVFDDSAGNRRFIVIEIQKVEWSKLKEIPIDEIWKEAKFYYSLGAYNKSIDGLNAENNSKYEKTSQALEALDALYDLESKDSSEWYTTTEIQSYIEMEMHIRLNVKSLGEALNKVGFVSKSKKISGVSVRKYNIAKKPFSMRI